MCLGQVSDGWGPGVSVVVVTRKSILEGNLEWLGWSGRRVGRRPAGKGPVVPARALVAGGAAGLLDIVGFVAFAIGLEIAPTWIVGLASSFGPAVAVIVAVALWGERLRPTQWLGLAGIALGLVAVALP